MSLIASLGAIEIGLIFGLVALGVFLSFRIINFPDLTVDGSFPLGGAVAAALIVAGWNPFAATAAAIAAGALAGYITACLNVRLRIMQLLASILVMIALYSVNLRIMGKPNVALINDATVFSLVENGFLVRFKYVPGDFLAHVRGQAVHHKRAAPDLFHHRRVDLIRCATAWRCARQAATRAWHVPRASRPTG